MSLSPPGPRPGLAPCRRRGMIQALSLLPWLGLVPGARAAEPAATASPAPHSGEWISAYAAYGDPKYAPGFDHFDYVNPAAPKGGTLHLRNPDRRSSFDKFNPFTMRGNAPAGVADLHARDAGDAVAATSRRRCTACSREDDAGSRRTSRRSPSGCNPKARFNNGDPVTGRRREVQLRIADEQVRRRPDVQTRAAGVARRGRRRRAHGPLRSARPHQATSCSSSALMPVFSRKWGSSRRQQKRFDQIVDE